MVTLFDKSSCRQPMSTTLKHWEDILHEASHAPPLADTRSASAPQHRRPSPSKRRSLERLEAEKQHVTQAVANELVPLMEAAQSAYDRENAALNAALQAHAAAAQSEQGSAHATERFALERQIEAVHTAHVAALKMLEATAHRRLAAIEETHQASIAKLNPSGRDSRESPSPLARTRAPAASRPMCVLGAAADAPGAAAMSVVAVAASPDGRRVTLGSRRRSPDGRRSLPSAAYEAAAAAAAAASATTESLEAQNARLVASSAAYREAAEGERFEREIAEEQLGRARGELDEALETLVRTERQLAEALGSCAAWREAAQAKGSDLQVRREQGTRKAHAVASVAARRAEQLALDVATLQAAALLQEVDAHVVGWEIAELEGQVNYLRTQLLYERDALAVSRAAESSMAARLHKAVEGATSAQLEVDFVRNQGHTHKQIAEGLRTQLRGAQAWAVEAETSFEEMLSQVRHTAGEEMAVHTRRCRLLDEQLARQLASGHLDSAEVRGCIEQLRSLLEQERQLSDMQAKLLHEGRSNGQQAELQLERRRSDDLAAQIAAEAQQKFDFQARIDAVVAENLHARLQSQSEELTQLRRELASCTSLAEQQQAWHHSQFALARQSFDGALLRVRDEAAVMSAEAQEAIRPPPAARAPPTPHDDHILEAGAWDPLAVRREVRGAAAAEPRHSSAAERGEQWNALAARAVARSGGGEAVGGEAAGGGASGAASGGASGGASGEARLIRELQSHVAELGSEVGMLRREAEAKVVRVGAAHRRELLEAQRWGSALEAQLGLAQAAPSTWHDGT
jgi:hypothetical protein